MNTGLQINEWDKNKKKKEHWKKIARRLERDKDVLEVHLKDTYKDEYTGSRFFYLFIFFVGLFFPCVCVCCVLEQQQFSPSLPEGVQGGKGSK